MKEEKGKETYNDLLLIVEDSDVDYEATVRALRKANLGNQIVRCADGDEALDYLLRRGEHSTAGDCRLPGVILLDLNMPGTDGKEVLKEIKSHAVLKLIPTIVLTSSSDPRDIEECYQLGANSYIEKPVGFEGLVASLTRLKEYWFDIVVRPQPGGA